MGKDSRRHLRFACVLLTMCALVFPVNADASGVGSAWEGFTRIRKGVFELALDNMLLARYRSNSLPGVEDSSRSVTDVVYVIGVTPRYFLIDNLAMGLSLNLFYQYGSETVSVGDTENSTNRSDIGFLGFLTTHYYVRLGSSMFFKPGIGLGYFSASRETPTDVAGTKLETDISGFAALLDLGFVFYTSEHFNIKAGFDLVWRIGNETPADGSSESVSFNSIDAGVSFGIAYSF